MIALALRWALVHAWMSSLSSTWTPGLPLAIARTTLTDDASFAALTVAVAWRESGFRNDARSATNDHCAMQVHGRPELAVDVDACVEVGVTMLRESARVDPTHPVAFYARGPAYRGDWARRCSDDRAALARWLQR